MKIFLNDNFILLEQQKPPAGVEDIIINKCSSLREVEHAFVDFNEKEPPCNLLLYPSSAKFDLPASFFSLFKVIEAAGGIVENEGGEFLFIYRWKKWDLPKGKLHGKKKESREEGAIREVMEETGLRKIFIRKELPPTFHIYFENDKRILKRTWWFSMSAQKKEILKPQAEEGITAIRWVDPLDMGPIVANTYASIRELIKIVTRDA